MLKKELSLRQVEIEQRNRRREYRRDDTDTGNEVKELNREEISSRFFYVLFQREVFLTESEEIL